MTLYIIIVACKSQASLVSGYSGRCGLARDEPDRAAFTLYIHYDYIVRAKRDGNQITSIVSLISQK